MSSELEVAFQTALSAATDRRAVIGRAASTAEMVEGRGNLIDAAQYQWPFMTALQIIQVWAGKDKLPGGLQVFSAAIVPAVLPTIVAHTAYHATTGEEFATFGISFVAIIILCRVWFMLRVKLMTEARATAIVEKRLANGAAKHPQRVASAIQMLNR